MKSVLSISIVLLIMMSSPPAKAIDSWTLYDDFNSEFLDIAKWGTSESVTGGVVVLEKVRGVQGQRLYMLNRDYGPTEAGLHRGDNHLAFHDPDSIVGIKASIKVNKVEITQCPADQPTRARARIVGTFFDTVGGCGSLPAPCGQANDVIAQILIQRFSDSSDRPGILRISGEVLECTDPSCFLITNYQSVDLGTVRVGQWATVSMEWIQANKQFIFQFGNEPPQTIEYPMNDMYPPNQPFKLIGLSPRLPLCASERQVGLIAADFENVFIK
jgi:hypothetical protein